MTDAQEGRAVVVQVSGTRFSLPTAVVSALLAGVVSWAVAEYTIDQDNRRQRRAVYYQFVMNNYGCAPVQHDEIRLQMGRIEAAHLYAGPELRRLLADYRRILDAIWPLVGSRTPVDQARLKAMLAEAERACLRVREAMREETE